MRRFFLFDTVADLQAHLEIADAVNRCKHDIHWVDSKRCGYNEDRNLFKLRNRGK